MNAELYKMLLRGGLNLEAAEAVALIESRLRAVELNADTATAGDPGSFSTSETYAVSSPNNLVELADVTASPTSHWVAGDYVTCVDGQKAYWDGSEYISGISPGFSATGATAGSPGAFTPTGANLPADLAALVALDPTPDPDTLWTTGDYVVLGDTSHAYWDSSEWLEGESPA